MENLLIIILLLIMWMALHSKMTHSSKQIDVLTKEIARLKKMLEGQTPEQPTEEMTAKTKQEPLPVGSDTGKEKIVQSVVVESQPAQIVADKVQKEEVKPVVKEKKRSNIERFIGENLFGKIGILTLVIGMGFFVAYAIDNNWIGEVTRTVLGFGVGFILLIVAGRLKEHYRTYSSILAGGAFAIFYVTVAMAYHYYDLFGQTAAFIILIVVTIVMVLLAALYGRRELAIIALIGGFIAPFMVSSGANSYVVLFTYILTLNLGMFSLSIFKRWGELPVFCFILTGFILFSYSLIEMIGGMDVTMRLNLLIFAVEYYLLFQLSIIAILRTHRRKVNPFLFGVATLNNFVFLFFGLWYTEAIASWENLQGVIPLFIACVNLFLFFWVRKKGERFRFLSATLLGMVITFLSIAIPIQWNGTLITLFWASEMVLIAWLYTRFPNKVYRFFIFILPLLTFASYLLDIENGLTREYLYWGGKIFTNGLFFTGLYSGIAFFVYAWIKNRIKQQNIWHIWAGCFVIYSAFILEFYLHIDQLLISRGYMLAFTAFTLCGLSGIFSLTRFPMSKHAGKYMFVLGTSLFLFWMFSISINNASHPPFIAYILLWISFVVIILHLCLIVLQYYKVFGLYQQSSNKTTVYLAIISTLLLVVGTTCLLHQWGLKREVSAGISIALGVAGFAQMAIGMHLHLKVLRMVSLVTFGLVLAKLVIIDLWLLPTIGKVIVFILLGILLLLLSFLYQKLKVVFLDEGELSVVKPQEVIASQPEANDTEESE
ncbi:DUF2339 domain-containing protein [Parabacteroides sp. PF5-9]|uniref:DUF2339 domain-containing protein n=1 Tax=Parabacteroides sp. PF5-9 TaxID=1742404 RepID=UPI002473C764|nr:DUF2339 domain-containing protein [Parabacteroides sp. PF5-9]MDH6356319.1 putative membrane protein [Parabacteroides sp. PF5-9]